jgi:hypothetical protein
MVALPTLAQPLGAIGGYSATMKRPREIAE